MSFKEDDDTASSTASVFSDSDDSGDSRQRRVNFQEAEMVYHVTNLADVSPSDYRSMWYQKDDFEQMRRHGKKIMDRMKREENFRLMDHNSHGVYSEEQASRRRLRIWNAQEAVVNEVAEQEEFGFDDTEMVSQIYLECSSLCQWEAIQRAKLLARRVKENWDFGGDDDLDVDDSLMYRLNSSSHSLMSPRESRLGSVETGMSPCMRRGKTAPPKSTSLPESAPEPIVEIPIFDARLQNSDGIVTNKSHIAVLEARVAKRIRDQDAKSSAPAPRTSSLPKSYKKTPVRNP